MRFAAALALSVAASACSGSGTETRASAAQPTRIASVNLGADEILIELVDPSRLVAVSRFVDDPALSNAAGKYPPQIARVTADLERIVGLRPDLVCANPYNSADFLDLLRASGLATFRFDAVTSFEGIEKCILALGERVGEPARAQAVVDAMHKRLAAVDERLRGVQKKPRVFYWAAGWTAGRGSTIGELIERAGAINAASEPGAITANRTGMFELSVEQVVNLDPDVLIRDGRDSLAELPGRELPPQLSQMRAVREGRVVSIPGSQLTAISHHIVEGVEALARALHPDRFPSDRR